MLSADSLPSFGQSPMLAVDLRGEDGPSRAGRRPGEPAADDLLGRARARSAVDVGGVEEVDARLVGDVHDRVRVLLRVWGRSSSCRGRVGRLEAGPAESVKSIRAAFHLRAAAAIEVPGVASGCRGPGLIKRLDPWLRIDCRVI